LYGRGSGRLSLSLSFKSNSACIFNVIINRPMKQIKFLNFIFI